MESYCLTREEYKDFINHIIYNKELDNCDLEYYIERARDYFDCNIIGSNFYLSIILEQLMKIDEFDEGILLDVYKLQDTLFFSIEEHGYDFVNNLFEKNIPEEYNKYRKELQRATEKNDEGKLKYLKSIFGMPFDQDLNRILGSYHEG